MRTWLYQLLTRLADWMRPNVAPEPLLSARPQIYAQGLWEANPDLPSDVRVAQLLQDIAWQQTTPPPFPPHSK